MTFTLFWTVVVLFRTRLFAQQLNWIEDSILVSSWSPGVAVHSRQDYLLFISECSVHDNTRSSLTCKETEKDTNLKWTHRDFFRINTRLSLLHAKRRRPRNSLSLSRDFVCFHCSLQVFFLRPQGSLREFFFEREMYVEMPFECCFCPASPAVSFFFSASSKSSIYLRDLNVPIWVNEVTTSLKPEEKLPTSSCLEGKKEDLLSFKEKRGKRVSLLRLQDKMVYNIRRVLGWTNFCPCNWSVIPQSYSRKSLLWSPWYYYCSSILERPLRTSICQLISHRKLHSGFLRDFVVVLHCLFCSLWFPCDSLVILLFTASSVVIPVLRVFASSKTQESLKYLQSWDTQGKGDRN